MNKHPSNVRKIKHFLLGAGLALVITFTASSVFAQSLAIPLQGGLMPCGSLGNKMTTPAECDAADAAAGVSRIQQAPPNPPCAAGQVPTNERPCMPQFGQQQMGQQLQPVSSDQAAGERDSIERDMASGRLKAGQMVGCYSAGGQPALVEVCLQAAKDAIASGGNFSMPQNQQTSQSNFQNPFMPSNPQYLMQKATQDIAQMEKDIAEGKMKLEQKMPFCQWNRDQPTLVEDCLQLAKDAATGKTAPLSQPNFQNQQSLFGQQQFSQEQKEQPNVNLVKPISKMSTSLKRKGIALADKLSSTLSKKFKSAKTENKRLAAVKSVARQASKVWKYVESAYGEIDEDIFDFDSSMADIADALKSRDPDLAYELTQDVLESMKQLLEQ